MTGDIAPEDKDFGGRLAEIDEALRRGEPVDVPADSLPPGDAHDVSAALECLERIEQLWPRSGNRAERPDESRLGDFRLIRELGRGGMGVVYEARQITLNRRVAVKILPFAGALDSRRQQRFQNEAMAAAQLRHPHIVGVHFVGCERGVHFYAMEFIEGHTLAELLEELRQQSGRRSKDGTQRERNPTSQQLTQQASQLLSGRLSMSAPESVDGESADTGGLNTLDTEAIDTEPFTKLSTQQPHQASRYFRQVAEWGRQIADALEYSHSVGVIHRDIKPSNLLLDVHGHVWVTDYGLAQISTGEAGLTTTGDILGTLRYMSPEQALGNHRVVDHRSDLYSLGITLYELLTLEPAFPGSDRVGLLHDVTETEPKPPRQIDAAIPQDLETIVLKAIRKGPRERYASLQELADELDRFLAHQPIRGRRPSLRDRMAKWSRRHRAIVFTGSLLMLVLTIVVAVAAVLVVEERGKRIQEEQAREHQEAIANLGAENARNHRYVSDVQLAWQAWNGSQLTEMRRHLLRCRPAKGKTDLRSWDWHYL